MKIDERKVYEISGRVNYIEFKHVQGKVVIVFTLERENESEVIVWARAQASFMKHIVEGFPVRVRGMYRWFPDGIHNYRFAAFSVSGGRFGDEPVVKIA